MPSPPGTPVRYSNLPSLDVVGLDDAYLADEEDSSDGEGDSDSSSMNMEVWAKKIICANSSIFTFVPVYSYSIFSLRLKT